MDRKVKAIAITAIAAIVLVSAVIVLYPRGSEEPTVLEAHVIGLDSFGNYTLDVTEEQLHELGANAGYDLYLDIDGERLTAMHCHGWNGMPYGAIFLNYNASANEISLGLYNAYIREEIPLKSGDEVGISLKGPNKYYDSLDRYLEPFSGNADDYASEEIFANFRELTGASLKEDLIYRSASPWTTKDDRTYYVNKLCGEEGIDSLILLDIYQGDLDEAVQPFKDLYCYGLYASGHVQANKFHPAVLSSKDDLRKFFEMLDGADGKVCIACKLGKDRTGTFCAMLQALAGASYEEICDEFMVSITNYYGIEKGTEEYETVENIYIHPLMYSIKHPEIIGNFHGIDWETIDFEPFDPYDAVYSFLTSYAGVDSALIDRVIDKITAR